MKRALGLITILAVTSMATVPAAAQALDPASATALAATLRLLQDPAQRSAAISGNPQAAATNQQIQTMLTPELQEEFYALAATIFADLVQASGGDAGRMAQTLAAAQADPAGFVASLSPQTAERLHAFAAKIGDQKP
jgi:hypothetical protein